MSSTVQIIIAVVTTLPALIAAVYAADTRRHVNTKNGKNIAAYIVEAKDVLDAVTKALGQVQADIKPPSHETLGEAVEKTHALSAIAVAQNTELLKANRKADV